MRFGIFYEHQLPKPWNEGDEARLFHQALEQVVLADRLGYDYAWEVEHHFLEEYSHSSAPEVFLAACAALTKNIRVGHGIRQVIPNYNHPARTAEGLATLDIISRGRLDFGIGEGATRLELGGFHIPAKEKRAMCLEAAEQIANMMVMEPYPGFEGKSFSFPCRNVLPKPYVKPHPPMWVAAGNPGTFEKAAQLGLGVLCFTGGAPSKMAPLIELYKKNIANAEPVGDFVNDNVAVTTSFMCLESRDEARELLTRSGNGRQQSLVFKYLDTFPKPAGVPEWPEEIPDPTLDQIEKGFQSGASIVGTPDDCAEALQKWEDVGVDQLIMGPSGSVFPHELLARTVKLFGDEVIPRFDKDPEHSTSRYRREAAQRLGV